MSWIAILIWTDWAKMAYYVSEMKYGVAGKAYLNAVLNLGDKSILTRVGSQNMWYNLWDDAKR